MDLKCFLFWTARLSLFALLSAAGTGHAVNEADIFDWWDGGIITPEQAQEMLALLDEGNEGEACLLAEVYAQEPCAERKRIADTRRKKRTAKQKSPGIIPHGSVTWKARLDSTGRIESLREELDLSFYRYTLRLGTQELLTYKNGGNEAHLGQISTKELHSHFPLDTLWGTALLYPIGNFHLAGLLDTSRTVQARGGYTFNSKSSAEGIFWFRKNHRDKPIYSGALQTKFNLGKISGWWEAGQKKPLVKAELSQTGIPSWKTTLYAHGDSVPSFARLSPGILKSRLWGSQTVSATAKNFLDTKGSLNARFINPLHSDSVQTRFKATLQSGPPEARVFLGATCLEGSENCRRTDWIAGVTSQAVESWTLGGKGRVRHTRGEGFGPPRLELGVQYQDSPKNRVKTAIVAPDGLPTRRLQIQNEVHLHADFLDFSLTTTFKNSKKTPLHPVHGAVTTQIAF